MRAVKPYIISKGYELRKKRQLIVTLLVIACLLLLILFYNIVKKNYTGNYFRKAIVFGNGLLTKREGSNTTKVLFTVTVAEDNANIRKAPSKSSYVIAKANKGSTLGVVETKGDWYKCIFKSGMFVREKEPGADFGWIHKSMVIAKSEVPSPPPSESAKIDKPPMPYKDYGACPFECCTYREWIAKEDISMLQDMREDSLVAFQIQKDEKVTAETGVVVTTKLGSAKIEKPLEDGNIRIAEGTIVYILSYSGEGFWKIWYQDKIITLQVEPANKPETIWWVRIKNRDGQTGWSNHPEAFGNMDACG